MSELLEARRAVASEFCGHLESNGLTDLLPLAHMLEQRFRQPRAYVTMTGETSTGKSSLVNALFGRFVLPVGAEPTTGIVTHVACQLEGKDRWFAIFRDATQTEIDRGTFERLSCIPDEDLLRLQVRAPPPAGDHAGLQVFDTPGYNAILLAHEEVLRAFLPQSDVIVFVAGYRSGFGQVDQDLFELVRQSIEGDPDLPVILVINRTPGGTAASNSRVREIVENASDSLRRPPTLILIPSASQESDTGASANSDCPAMPDAVALWREVSRLVLDPARTEAVELKLAALLAGLIDDADATAEREELAATASEADLSAMREQIAALRRALTLSLSAVAETMGRLRSQLPGTIKRSASTLKKDLRAEVDASNRWLGAEDCAEWLTGHAMPFAVRAVARSVEDQIALELDRLDARLEEIANTTVAEVERTIAVPSRAAEQFAENLARNILQRVAGSAVRTALRGVGGVGGAAAGAGNVAKMAVAKLGRLAGQRFGREVYNQIGRAFTKRALQRLTVAIAIVTEALLYVRHVQTWQADLKKRVDEAIDDWAEGVAGELNSEVLPAIEKANVDNVHIIFDDLVSNQVEEHRAGAARTAERLARVRELRANCASMKARIAINGQEAT